MTGIREDGEQPRIKELLQQAIQSIDHARSALTRKEARGFADHVWLAAFYLEYLTFVLSLTRPPADDAWKQRATRARAGDVAATVEEERVDIRLAAAVCHELRQGRRQRG